MLKKLDRKFKYLNKNKCCSKISIPSLHLLDPDQREVNFLAEYGHSYGINMNMEYGHTQPRT